MGPIVVSAPGKVILHGEHAVVYGKKAIASSLNVRTHLKLQSNDDGKVSLNLPDINVTALWDTEKIENIISLPCISLCSMDNPCSPSDTILEEFRKLCNISPDESSTRSLALVAFLHLFCSIAQRDGKLPSVQVSVESEMPPGAGLGSSAAYSTCLASSLLLLSGLIPHPDTPPNGPSQRSNSSYSWKEKTHLELINKWAFEAEKLIHGKPSGIDNSISTFGGAISFQKGEITPLEKMPTLKILLTYTKVPRSTKVLVAGVRERYDKHRDIIEPILTSIEAISTKCEDLLCDIHGSPSTQQISTLSEMIEMNQHLLASLGVSHASLQNITMVTNKYQLSSKLTGAGGGGCAFTLLSPGVSAEAVSAMMEELASLGYECWETYVGGPGVLYHTA